MTENSVHIIVFSKDRALQLDAALSSLRLHADGELATLHVLWKGSSPRHASQYSELQVAYPGARFIQETNFRSQIQDLLSAPYVMLLSDDTIFIRRFSLNFACKALDEVKEAAGFSFRLGRTTKYCYTLDRPQALPEFIPLGSSATLGFWWPGSAGDFNNAFETSASLYRGPDLVELISKLPFKAPVSMETAMIEASSSFQSTKPILLVYEEPVAFSNQINRVQDELPKIRCGTRIENSLDELAKQFESGARIDVATYAGFTSNSCHHEVALKFRNDRLKIGAIFS